MIVLFGCAVWSEWLKRKRSLTTWLVIGSAAFVPGIIFLSRFRRIGALPALYRDPRFWDTLWVQAWESMALMILPMAVMLAVSLITQIEDRDNGWKQLHAAPLPRPAIFLSKLVVILVLVVELVLAFTAAIYAAGMLPALIFTSVDAPVTAFPLSRFLRRDVAFLIDALPIVAIQYLLALRFRTFVAPLAIGMALWILSVGTISWRFNFLIPYSYAGLDYLIVEYRRPLPLPADPFVIAGACFLVFSMAGYGLYAIRRESG
jgi:lantibiotic transport system permease protein